MMPDAPMTDLCGCDGFVFWYLTDSGTKVCGCGHPRSEHLDGRGSCTGEIRVLPAVTP